MATSASVQGHGTVHGFDLYGPMNMDEVPCCPSCGMATLVHSVGSMAHGGCIPLAGLVPIMGDMVAVGFVATCECEY